MQQESWKNISVREKMQIVNGTSLVFAAIILYFVAFIMTLTIGYQIISAGATLLGSGLAFFGITAFVKNQMVQFEATVDGKLKRMEEIEKAQREKNAISSRHSNYEETTFDDNNDDNTPMDDGRY